MKSCSEYMFSTTMEHHGADRYSTHEVSGGDNETTMKHTSTDKSNIKCSGEDNCNIIKHSGTDNSASTKRCDGFCSTAVIDSGMEGDTVFSESEEEYCKTVTSGSSEDGYTTHSGSFEGSGSSISDECTTAVDSDNGQDMKIMGDSGHGSCLSIDDHIPTPTDSRKSSPNQKAPEVTLDDEFLKSSFHRHEQAMELLRDELKDLPPSMWPMDLDPAIRQEMAWEALRNQPPPPPDVLESLEFEDPQVVRCRVPPQISIQDDDPSIIIEEISRPSDEVLPDCDNTALVRYEASHRSRSPSPPLCSRSSSLPHRRHRSHPGIPVRLGNFDVLIPQEVASHLSRLTFHRFSDGRGGGGRRERKFAEGKGHSRKNGCSRIARQIIDNFSSYKRALSRCGRCMCCTCSQHSTRSLTP